MNLTVTKGLIKELSYFIVSGLQSLQPRIIKKDILFYDNGAKIIQNKHSV